MATYKPAAHIADIRGHIQNTTYSRNRLGNFMKTRKGPLDRRSLSQLTVRNNFLFCSNYWHNILDDADRLTWTNLSLLTTFMNSAGIQFHPSGFNLFMRQALFYQDFLETFSDIAPTAAAAPAPTFTISCTAGGLIYITGDGGWCTGKTGFVRKFISPPLPPGRMTWSGPWTPAGGGFTKFNTIAYIDSNIPTCAIGNASDFSVDQSCIVHFKASYVSGPGLCLTWPQFARATAT